MGTPEFLLARTWGESGLATAELESAMLLTPSICRKTIALEFLACRGQTWQRLVRDVLVVVGRQHFLILIVGVVKRRRPILHQLGEDGRGQHARGGGPGEEGLRVGSEPRKDGVRVS